MPTLRALAERGVVAERMATVFPSTTWPSHVSLVTGVSPAQHGVVGNSLLNRATRCAEDLTGDPIYDAPEILRAPTVYDRAHAARLKTAAIDWPATRGAPTLDFNLPFFKDQRVYETKTAPAVWAELTALGYPVHRQGEWAQLPKRFLKDAMVADLAAHVVRRHTPDLLLAHFLCVDSFQHLFGPRSPEAYWAIEYVDGRLRDFLATLPPGELDARTVLLVVSDHGFLPAEREIRVNVRLKQLGLLGINDEPRPAGGDVRFVSNHGVGYVYVLEVNPEPALRNLRPELLQLEGVANAWTTADYPALGLSIPSDNPYVGDLLLEAAPGYAFADDVTGSDVLGPPRYLGTHGQSPAHPDLGAYFLAAGPGIRRGLTVPAISSRDVAPTIAHLLDIEMGPIEGRVLSEILG
jgi:predicted AlkP superfamily pyrophosphatase or phosphodiesterase